MKKFFLLALVCLFYSLVLSKLVLLYQADVAYTKSKRFLKAGNTELSLEYAHRAIRLNPKEPNYYRGRARTYLVQTIETSDTNALKEQVLADLETALALNPRNLATIRNSFALYYFLAAKDLTLPASPQNVDFKFLPYTRDFYNTSKEKYPNDVGVFVSVAKYEKQLNLEEDYAKSVARIKELRPDLLDWHPVFLEDAAR